MGTAKHASKAVVNMQTQASGGISVAFVSLADGAGVTGRTMDLGTVAYYGYSRAANVQVRALKDRLVVSTKLGLVLQDPSQQFTRATLLASLAYPDPVHVLWLDGVRLGTTPQVIQAQAPVGKTSAHRLEIEVPTSLTERNSGLQNSIVVQVVPN